MDSLIYRELNLASRSKDNTKIETYGPYAAALNFIISASNKKRMKDDKIFRIKHTKFNVYRGVTMNHEEFIR